MGLDEIGVHNWRGNPTVPLADLGHGDSAGKWGCVQDIQRIHGEMGVFGCAWKYWTKMD